MKNRKDIEVRLRAELTLWRDTQVRDLYTDYFLWYLPTTAEHDGGFLIARSAPPNPEFLLATPERINKSKGVEGNCAQLLPFLLRLPILSR